MPKYIVKPGQRVTHGSEADAKAHFAKYPGQPIQAMPPVPLVEYEEGDEIELTEQQAEQMPHAVCTPEEFDDLASPTAFRDRGYSLAESEEKAAKLRAGTAGRKQLARDAKAQAAKDAVDAGKPKTTGVPLKGFDKNDKQ